MAIVSWKQLNKKGNPNNYRYQETKLKYLIKEVEICLEVYPVICHCLLLLFYILDR